MRGWAAAMEPGLRDREYPRVCRPVPPASDLLQWSPVLETGNTRRQRFLLICEIIAAMEPGLIDREYPPPRPRQVGDPTAAMEPGLRDREYRARNEIKKEYLQAAMEPGLRDREYRRGLN